MNDKTNLASGGKSAWSRIKDVVEKVFRWSLPFAISILLVIWLFHKVDFHEMVYVIRHECNFWWIALMMVITMLSHMIRGTRWGIQLRGAGLPRVSPVIEWISIFGAYALNLLFPYLGETWRCLFMAKRERSKISTVVGTDFGDRGSDAVVIMTLFGVAMIVAHKYMEKFLDHYSIGERLCHYMDKPGLWIGLVIGVAVIWFVLYFFRHYRLVQKIDGSIDSAWKGFKVLFTMKGRGWYVVLTLGIWTCYFLETYVGLHAFPFTRGLLTDPGSAYGLIPGLVVFVFGSFSMAIPSNGGLGPWNVAVMFALSLYGISDTQGVAYSIVMWGCQTIMLIILGIFSAIYIATHKMQSNDK